MRLKDQSAQKFRRQTIIRLHEEGNSQKKIGELLEITQSYVSRIIRAHKEHGVSALEVSTGKGAVSRLNDTQRDRLREVLDAGASAHGFEGEIWTSKRVRLVIEELFGVHYSQRQVDRIVKQLGYTRQKPQKVDYRQSKADVESWKTAKLPALKKSRRGTKNNSLPG